MRIRQLVYSVQSPICVNLGICFLIHIDLRSFANSNVTHSTPSLEDRDITSMPASLCLFRKLYLHDNFHFRWDISIYLQFHLQTELRNPL